MPPEGTGMIDEANTTAAVEPDHPHEGIPEEGWSAPVVPPGSACDLGKLVVKRNGAETDVEFSLAPPAIIGRFDPAIGPIDVDLGPLPEGTYVSRKHAKLSCQDGQWSIHDLGSSNGTFVLRDDFERITDCNLNDGDEIALGNARFVFHVTASGPPPEVCPPEPAEAEPAPAEA